MGRYYKGDIEGKFMFGVQGSDAGERFGAVENGYTQTYCAINDFTTTDSLHYDVHRECYELVVEELRLIEESGALDRVQRMLEDHNGWNNEIAEKCGVSRKDLEDYADYRMGNRIKDWFDDNSDEDSLSFEAEC